MRGLTSTPTSRRPRWPRRRVSGRAPARCPRRLVGAGIQARYRSAARMTWTPSTSTSWWSRTSRPRSTSPAPLSYSRRSSRADWQAGPISVRSATLAPATHALRRPTRTTIPDDWRVGLGPVPLGHEVDDACRSRHRPGCAAGRPTTPASETTRPSTATRFRGAQLPALAQGGGKRGKGGRRAMATSRSQESRWPSFGNVTRV